jgi:hypothetical protein
MRVDPGRVKTPTPSGLKFRNATDASRKILSQYDIADAGGLAILVGLSIVASNVPSRSLATA